MTPLCSFMVFLSCRTPVSWDTDIALLAGQEVSVELKDSLDFPATTDITHNFVSMSVISVVLVVGSLDLRPGHIAVRQLCAMIRTHTYEQFLKMRVGLGLGSGLVFVHLFRFSILCVFLV